MRRVVLIGSGGHAREVLDILLAEKEAGHDIQPIGFIDENTSNHGRRTMDLPVLGDWSWFDGVNRNEVEIICAVGTPGIQRTLCEKAIKLGLRFGRAVSPAAVVSPYARLEEGVMVFPFVAVNPGASIGKHVILNIGASVSHDTRVGRHSNINPGARLAGNVTVGEECYIGMGANVIQGVVIGESCVIGAGAAVTEDLPSRITAVGVPARPVKTSQGERRS